MIKRYINNVIIIVHICTRASNPVIFEFGIVKRLEQLLIKRYINKVIIIIIIIVIIIIIIIIIEDY